VFNEARIKCNTGFEVNLQMTTWPRSLQLIFYYRKSNVKILWGTFQEIDVDATEDTKAKFEITTSVRIPR
jgi:hypothetical protein